MNKNKRALIQVMIALSFIVIIFSYFYYKGINSAKDPRVKLAREIYKNYNTLASQNDFENVFILLDSIEYIYNSIDHYKESFEVGVLYNNRAAAYLTMAIHNNRPEYYSVFSKDSLLKLAQTSVNKSIQIYTDWIHKYDQNDINQLEDFLTGLEQYTEKEQEHYLKSRIKEIETAKLETKRRLSVAYTNLGIIYRHFNDYENAIQAYQKAIELWGQNLSAENNLHILLGKPLKKRNLIQKLFPPNPNKD